MRQLERGQSAAHYEPDLWPARPEHIDNGRGLAQMAEAVTGQSDEDALAQVGIRERRGDIGALYQSGIAPGIESDLCVRLAEKLEPYLIQVKQNSECRLPMWRQCADQLY